MTRTTGVPFRQWPWRKRFIEKLYRLTHGGQIRTLVIRRDGFPPTRPESAARKTRTPR